MEPLKFGTVKFFNTQKGFGFIDMDDGGEMFVHFTGIIPPAKSLLRNHRVSFHVVDGRKGPIAVDVQDITETAPAPELEEVPAVEVIVTDCNAEDTTPQVQVEEVPAVEVTVNE